MTKEKLIEGLISAEYLKTSRIIEAFRAVDRADFVPKEYQSEAYGNYPLSIGEGQTISQPLTVAFILELLQPQIGDKVLDVGAGSGWQTALIAYCVGEKGKVVAVERIKSLKDMADSNIKKYPKLAKRAEVILGDGSKGYKPGAPYDKIIAAASGEDMPDAWRAQLKIHGRIVAPVQNSIVVWDKIDDKQFKKQEYSGFSFVPLIRE
ncbi:MAG: protein-L-isoaspartate O-methyltransferase [Candidatus Colwellbacteria bacterium]|nr:protein-L-isoaspartate O-methyltransferase [Candidatus Colwellbacteria bacterium]